MNRVAKWQTLHRPDTAESARITGGESKASWPNGVRFIQQMASLPRGRMTRFAGVGVLGVVVNLLVMALLVHGEIKINYVVAAVIAAEISILQPRQSRWPSHLSLGSSS